MAIDLGGGGSGDSRQQFLDKLVARLLAAQHGLGLPVRADLLLQGLVGLLQLQHLVLELPDQGVVVLPQNPLVLMLLLGRSDYEVLRLAFRKNRPKRGHEVRPARPVS